MKKILLAAFTLVSTFGFNAASAQTFVTSSGSADTVWGTLSSTISSINLHNNIKSAGATPVTITWRYDASSIAPKMGIGGICDNNFCRDSATVIGTPFATYTSSYGTAMEDFHVIFYDYGAPVGTVSWVSANVSSGATTRRLVFMATKVSGTNVPSVPSSDNISVYPNPARDFVNVTYDAKAGVKTIAIYNLIGKAVQTYKVTDNASAKLDLDNIPAGVYFIRMINAQGQIIATRRFTRQ